MYHKGAVLFSVIAFCIAFTPGSPAATNKISPTPPVKISLPHNQEYTFTEEKDGLEFKVTLNQSRFTLQDEIKVHLKVTNISDKEIPTFAGVASKGCMSVGISDMDKNFRLAYKPSQYDLPAEQVVAEGILKPGASIEHERILLPKIDFHTEQIEAWGGTYRVGAGMSKGATDYSSVSFPITIESNAKKLIPPEAAEKVAHESKEYKEWFSEHTGNAVLWIEGDQYYQVLKGEVYKGDKSYYEKAASQMKAPMQSTHFENRNWVVRSSSYYGKSPMSIEIKVDAVKGDITSVEYPKY